MNDDGELLRRFVAESSEAAFHELVVRRIDFVYTAALRQAGGDAHLAQEVVQSVFLDLARKARALAPRRTLAGWLYTSTRFAAAKALRSRARRMNHETEAHSMQQILTANPAAEIDWKELRPVIDEAMHELGDSDREAILLRFFEGRSLAEVGAAIGFEENSARMRVERALKKLRVRLARRGITSTAVALGETLAGQPVVSAPAGMATTVATVSLSGVAASGLPAWTGFLLMSTKLQLGAISVLVALGAAAYQLKRSEMRAELAIASDVSAGQRRESTELQTENRRLAAKIQERPAPRSAAAKGASSQSQKTAADAKSAADSGEQERQNVLHNLRQISAARNQFLLEHGRAPTGLDELVGPDKYIKRLVPVNGEDYSRLEFGRGKKLSVTTVGNVNATVELDQTTSAGAMPSASGLTAPAMRLGWSDAGLTLSTGPGGSNDYTIPGTAMESKSAPPYRRNSPTFPSPALLNRVVLAIDSYRAANEGRNPPVDEPQKLLAFFQRSSDAADFVEWLEARRAAGR